MTEPTQAINPGGEDCEAGESWIIQLTGDDNARREQIIALNEIPGLSGIRVPEATEAVPHYVGRKLADSSPAHRNAVPNLIAQIGVRITVDSNQLSLPLLNSRVLRRTFQPIGGLTGEKERKAALTVRSLVSLERSISVRSRNHALFEAIKAVDLHLQPATDVRIAVVDDGIAPHPDLIGSVSHAGTPSSIEHGVLGRKVLATSDIWWDIHENACYGAHGTLVAGAIGAQRDGERIGIFPGATIDAWSPAGNCANRETECPMCKSALQFTSTIRAAIEHGARIVNVSYAPLCREMGQAIWHDTIEYAAGKNAIIVIAAGNTSSDLDETCLKSWRKKHDNVAFATSITGNSIDQFGYGAETVSLAVPFPESMHTTSVDPDAPSRFGYAAHGETSLAAAIVSAAAAMVLSHPTYRGAPAGAVIKALEDNASRIGLDPEHPIDPSGGILSLDFLRT